ncbi:glycosyltransferase family 4 protein [Candidatus Woesearchaeota archaeon]|jgi:glycosyltransferase involved in cell wall biosynthesis|nr:glycosyltransferase family 4 protein [Candidatus Woesearchaeota archaeon]MBT7296282.1 glycosyltransferase family 4 protein [Candidatus Woesearchaeota archaeon]
MKILFLTRVHPPVAGGLENQSYNLIKYFKKINKETFTIINKKGKKNLPFFIPYSFFKALYIIKKNKITHMHLSDGVLAFEGCLIKKLTGVKTAITIHGLDITYKNKIYQKIIPKSINELDKIICVSNNTKEICIKKGISKNKISVIHNGVNSNEFILKNSKEKLREKISSKINVNLHNKKILLTSGRLVERKGVKWFINSVMTKLNNEYIYLISGDGEDKTNIEKAIKKNNLNNKIFLLGKVDFETLKLLYNSSDLFIMPNISVKDNIEGFGIVAIEAGSCGLPVITSGIEGIKDAIINNKTGWVVGEKNTKEFIKKIKNKKLNKKTIKKIIKEKFEWKTISKKYLETIK